jgi:hypothetical protein
MGMKPVLPSAGNKENYWTEPIAQILAKRAEDVQQEHIWHMQLMEDEHDKEWRETNFIHNWQLQKLKLKLMVAGWNMIR